jgi:small subunit ribosomal protein S27Ae
MAKKKTKSIKKGKKPHKNKPTSKKYLKYKIGPNGVSSGDGDKITRERFCPRCGPGVFLMNSQKRFYCGKCAYSEFESKNKEVVQEIKT